MTIDCPERGLLLMKVRDEMKMSIAAYQTLYKSAVAFSMRKQIQAQEGKEKLVCETKNLREKMEELKEKKEALLLKKESLQKRSKEKRDLEANKRSAEIRFLDFQNTHLKQFFTSLETNN